MKRTDIHRPSAIVPADYEFVCVKYYGEMVFEGNAHAIELFNAHRDRTGGKFAHIEREGGGCDICGAHCMSVATFYHRPSNQYIHTGLDCAEKLAIGDDLAFRSHRRQLKLAKDAHARALQFQAGKAKAEALLKDAGLDAAWEVSEAGQCPEIKDEPERLRYRRQETWYLIQDVVGSVVSRGSLSDRQVDFLRSLLDRLAEAANDIVNARQGQASATEAPSGRVEVTGEVLTIRQPTFDDRFPSIKFLVKDDRGFKVWSTLPSVIGHVEKGARVRFTATLTPSDRDPYFAFAKRPTQARVLETAI